MKESASFHQPGQDVFKAVLPGDIEWKPFAAFPPSVRLAGGTSHFHWAKSGEYITQVTAIGPLGIEYADSNDDPRTKKVHGLRLIPG